MSSDFFSGCLVTMSFAIALFQLRFWQKSHDRLFLFFAVAFFLMAVNRVALSLVADESESRTYLYVVRLIAFVVILVGIWDKNRQNRRRSADGSSMASHDLHDRLTP